MYSFENINLLEYNFKIKNSFSVVYAGNIGKVQSLETLVKSCVYLDKYKSIKVFIVGDGSEFNNIKKLANKLNLKNLFFFDYVKEEDLINLLSSAKVLYLSLINDNILNSTIPSKFQNYLACAKPIVASISGETKKIISNSSCGLTCEPENEKELADTIIKISKISNTKLNIMGKNGLKYFLNYYHPNVINQKLVSHINNLIVDNEQ